MAREFSVLNKTPLQSIWERKVERTKAMGSLSIFELTSFFSDEQKSIKRGENHFKSNHVKYFAYSSGVLRGEIAASMKNVVYKVMIYLDYDYKIKSTECDCPRGAFKCSHAAAIFIHGIHHLSRTDIECQWKRTNSAPTLQAASEMFPPPKRYEALTRLPTAEDRSALYEDLKSYGKFTGLRWIMSPEPEKTPLPITTLEDVIYSDDFLMADGKDNQLKVFSEKMKIDKSKIKEVSSLTTGQRDNPLWHLSRRGRLTASNFGSVLKAKRVTPSLLKRLLGEHDLSRVKAISWGVTNEKEGVKAFTSITGLAAIDTGIWLDPSGILGASPDGLVRANALLEVKCPYTERNKTIEEAISSSTFYLKKADDGTLFLRNDHVYWHQVQGQLYLTQRDLCYFVVWTTKDSTCIVIPKDKSWKCNLEYLKDFYMKNIFPRIVEGEL